MKADRGITPESLFVLFRNKVTLSAAAGLRSKIERSWLETSLVDTLKLSACAILNSLLRNG